MRNNRRLGLLAAALQRPALLTRETMALRWTPQTLADGTVTNYSLEWYVGAHEGQREVYHPGAQSRVSSLLWLAPDEGIAVSILGHLEQVNGLGLARQLREIAGR